MVPRFWSLLVLCIAGLIARGQEAPIYPDKADLRYYLNADGKRQPVQTKQDWAIRVDHTRANMERVMGKMPPLPDVPLDIQVDAETPLRHYVRRHITFVAERGDRVPAYLLIPRGDIGKRPAMVCLPGSSKPGKDTPAGLTTNSGSAYAHELACRGYVCIVMDYPLLHDTEYKTDPYAIGYTSATMKGIINHRRAVDVLQSLPEVDGERIGVIGHSLGGHNAIFLAMFEPRIRAVVSSCGFNVFAKHAGGDVRAWSSRYYMPLIRSKYGDDPKRIPFDFTEVLGALAPRAIFVNAPLHDAPDFEVSGVRDCVDAALPIYRDLFRAADRLVVEYPDAGHAFPATTRHNAYAFLDQHLLISSTDIKTDDAIPRERWSAGKADFTIAARVAGHEGEWLSAYDPNQRRGWHLTLKSNPVTTSQANDRHLQFGIDDNRESKWEEVGRPGNALLAFALTTFEGQLYAGTCEPGKNESGHVYRYAGGQRWIDVGAPDRSNSVTSLAVFEGKLYAGTGKYRVAGSALAESENLTLGGRVFRYDGGTKWTDCGQLPNAEAIGGFAVYRGKLYASSLYKPAGFYRYAGGTKWEDATTPNGKRVEALAVYGDHLYGSSYDGGHVYQFDGKSWKDLGQLGDNTQTYSFAVMNGQLYVGTWPSGRVFQRKGDSWLDTGRLGDELEVMGMLVHNGRLIAGTLPLAEVYQFDGIEKWRKLTRLDHTPDVKYRRAWTMAEHDGRVFVSTLPSGKIYAWEAGKSAMWDFPFPTGERHVAAVKRGGRLELYVDGKFVAGSSGSAEGFDLGNIPIKVADGVKDLRLYSRALSRSEIAELAKPR